MRRATSQLIQSLPSSDASKVAVGEKLGGVDVLTDGVIVKKGTTGADDIESLTFTEDGYGSSADEEDGWVRISSDELN